MWFTFANMVEDIMLDDQQNNNGNNNLLHSTNNDMLANNDPDINERLIVKKIYANIMIHVLN